MYCYSFYDRYMRSPVPVYYDENEKLFFGIYQSHKIYISRKYNTKEKASLYFTFVCMEQDVKCPHRYLTDKFVVEDGEKGIDIGAAEGIFAIQVIERVEHIYLIEIDDDWIHALQITFKEYKDKVTIIRAYISNSNENGQLQLDDLFKNVNLDFIKMDIEGEELKALEGAKNILENNLLKLAICVYHHKEDFVEVKRLLEQIKYKCYHSYGYVICQGEWELERDETDFRRAVLFGIRGSEK